MLRSWLLSVAPLFWLGCGNDLGYDRTQDPGVDAASPHGGGLPCDVQTFLSDHCQGCHASQPVNGAPMSLMTYEDLTAKNGGGAMIVQRVLARIQSPTGRMPPLPAASATAAEISMFQAWVTADTPSGECTAGMGPFDSPPVCTSQMTWNGGDQGSPRMHPGRACITCHMTSEEAPQLTIGGTVYPTGHEPNDCNGATPATVEVTDANGGVTSLPVNAAGNFLTTAPIAFPIHVSVVANGKRRSMGGSPPTGNCNSCHTQDGANMAPGRIVLP